MSRITELLRRVENENPGLAADLRDEVKALAERRAFGLNFERHVPETVELPHRTVRRGDKVRFLAPRGESEKGLDKRLWLVTRVSGKGEAREAQLVEWDAAHTPEETARAIEDLVVVAEFRDPIYPGLHSTDKVARGGDKPYHLVINGENYHALDALLFAYEAKVDCIYIDPPYNTRDKDWKYNNDYVDSDDAYKHSKWLAMMERRLKLAKKLLNPEASVLIVTIDEKEVYRLGLLLEQTFTNCDIQMVSNVINPGGSARSGRLSRTDEYLFFVFVGEGGVIPALDSSKMGTAQGPLPRVWFPANRGGTGRALRTASPNLFYPVFIQKDSGTVHSVGEPLPKDMDRGQCEAPAGTVPLWPLGSGGREQTWRFSHEKMRTFLAEGIAKVTRRADFTIQYLRPGTLELVEQGVYKIVGRDKDGGLGLDWGDDAQGKPTPPKTAWRIASHSAQYSGTRVLSALIGQRAFPFPKSLYAVEDTLRYVVAEKPNALILDFFAGSGTTAHAVMRLNRQDGGRRQAILVTNNEVSADEEKKLRKKDLRPGDPDWEALGICEYITKPRIRAAITGETPEGDPIKGDYKFTDEFPMSEGFEENAEFFELTYEDPEQVRLDMAFAAVAPLLWIRAGSQGSRIDERSDTYDMTDTYGILFNIDAAGGFLKEAKKRSGLRVAYIVTDEEKQYQMVADRLPAEVDTVQLYEAYLTTFEINSARESR